MSAAGTRSRSGRTPSKRSVASRIATAPYSRTASTIGRTDSMAAATSRAARGSRPRGSAGEPRRSIRFNTPRSLGGAADTILPPVHELGREVIRGRITSRERNERRLIGLFTPVRQEGRVVVVERRQRRAGEMGNQAVRVMLPPTAVPGDLV